MKEVLIPLLVLGAMLTAIFAVLAASNVRRFNDDTGPPEWDDYDGWGSY